MKRFVPLPLHHSWAMWSGRERFNLGIIADRALIARDMAKPGQWACDLADDSLSWSDEIYGLFGIPFGARFSRAETVALYREESRAAMERLRTHTIRHRRGFTLDVEIRPAQGADRWVRLSAAPICEDGRVVRLHGLKQDVTALYRRPAGVTPSCG